MRPRPSLSLIRTVIACSLLGLPVWTTAQAPDRADRNSPIDAYCDRFAGAAREQCLGRAPSRSEDPRDGRERGGTCDGLPAPARARCLEQGGTVEVDGDRRPVDRAARRPQARTP